MSARKDIAALLTDVLPWDVYDHPRGFDGLERPAVVITHDTIERGTTLGLRKATVQLWLIVPQLDVEAAEDLLDAHLTTLLDVIEQLPTLGWVTSQRGTWADTFAAYRTDVTVETTKE